MDIYQKDALKTWKFKNEPDYMTKIQYLALGLNGEAGEVADKIKKVIRDSNGHISDERRKSIALEVGDIMWYITVMAHELDYSLQDIANMNIEKLDSRYKRGVLGGSGDNR